MSEKPDKVGDDGAEQSGGQLYRQRPKLQDRWSSLRRNPRFCVFAGIFSANAWGATLLWILIALGAGSGTIFGSTFVLIPLLMGMVGSYFWQGVKLSRAAILLYSLLNTVTALALAYLLFTNQVAFNEQLTVVAPGRQLTFVVTSQPNDPEAFNHLTLDKGQFLLQDNGDGTTTLIGTSWYRLNVYPAQYYDLWVQDIVRHVHSRVMGQVKRLAEASG